MAIVLNLYLFGVMEELYIIFQWHFNIKIFIIGIILSGICVLLLRKQFLVSDKEWLKK